MNSQKDSQSLNIQAELSSLFQNLLLPDGWTGSKKADTASSCSIPVRQKSKGSTLSSAVTLLLLLTQDSLKLGSEREGKYTANQDLYTCLYANLAALICEFCK